MVRNQKLADNGQSLICPDLGEYNYVDFRYDGQMIFYKADKYHVHRALGGPENANSFYGYCWKDK